MIKFRLFLVDVRLPVISSDFLQYFLITEKFRGFFTYGVFTQLQLLRRIGGKFR
jgi:hypothetical protein